MKEIQLFEKGPAANPLHNLNEKPLKPDVERDQDRETVEQDRLDDGNVDETPEDDKKETQASVPIFGLPVQHALEEVKKLLEDVPTESKLDFDHGSNATDMKSLKEISENTKVPEGTQSDVRNKDFIENPMKALQELFKQEELVQAHGELVVLAQPSNIWKYLVIANFGNLRFK